MDEGAAAYSRALKVRRLLSGGVTRDDSDDELGLDDHPWEWIYANNDASPKAKVVGAKMGTFVCKLGDCVLLKAEGANEAWVGLIHSFVDGEEDEKSANFLWFSSEKEIRNKKKKITDTLPNELYITADSDVNCLASINGTAQIMSLANFQSKYPSGKVPSSSKYHGKTFVCRRGCNTRTASYTEVFDWKDMYNYSYEKDYGQGHTVHGPNDINAIIDYVEKNTQATRRKSQTKASKEHENDDLARAQPVNLPIVAQWNALDNHGELSSTPKKRQKLQASTPKSRQSETKNQAHVTPTHKRVVVKRALEFTPLGTRVLSPNQTASSPFQIARTRLHVSAVPTALPCREEAFATVYSHLEAAISDGSGACIYISGTPGTGKTATVREVVAQLNAAVSAEELDDFIFVEINGLKITDPHQSYALLWEALRGDRVSPTHALYLLEREFSNPSPRRVPCVVLMDELDQLVTKNQSVMYNFFNWPGLRHSKLIVLAVANTMDLPERTLNNKINSRLGLTRITFSGYTHDQLMRIIESRLAGVPGNIVDSDAIQFASRKVAAVSGDARRALDICRRAVEIAETEYLALGQTFSTPSRSGRHKEGGPQGAEGKSGRVMINTIKLAIYEATTSPLQQCLKSLPLACKLFLAAFLARIRKSGVAESVLGDVVEEAKQLGTMADDVAIRRYLLTGDSLSGKENAQSLSNQTVFAARAFAMGAAAMELSEAGLIGLEPRKGERIGKIRLTVGEDEVTFALKEDNEVRDLGFSG